MTILFRFYNRKTRKTVDCLIDTIYCSFYYLDYISIFIEGFQMVLNIPRNMLLTCELLLIYGNIIGVSL